MILFNLFSSAHVLSNPFVFGFNRSGKQRLNREKRENVEKCVENIDGRAQWKRLDNVSIEIKSKSNECSNPLSIIHRVEVGAAGEKAKEFLAGINFIADVANET